MTGATRGLGLEIAKLLALSGALIIINGRSNESLNNAVSIISSTGATVTPLKFDVASERDVQQAFSNIKEKYGHLDILVNNVGIRDRRGLFEFEMDSVHKLLNTNLIAPFNLSRQAAQLMIENGKGRIINITSIAGSLADAGDTVYTITKGGLEALTRALAAELGMYSITVNAVAPGFFATESNLEFKHYKSNRSFSKSSFVSS